MRTPTALAAAILFAAAIPGCFGDILDGGQVRFSDYLRDDQYETWVIEIDYVEGFPPSSSAISTLKSRMGAVVNKDSIDVRVDDVLQGRDRWSSSQIADLERQHKDARTGDGTVVTWVAYLDGEFEEANVAGVTFGYDRIAMFPEAIDDACSIGTLCFGAETDLERAVLVHEFGHALGLVDRGAEMQRPHEDPDHPGHSSNRNSVMWWQVESVGSLAGLNNIPNTFDSDDRADLCAAGGRC